MVIGDRLLTDIYMANVHNLKSIYVKPVEISRINKHGLIVFFLRKC
jgi:predicted HAD superfamily phosphohydrolase YqeG